MEKKEFSKLIRTQRKKQKLTLYEFGEKLGVSWVTVWRWENEYNMPREDALGYWIERIK